MNSAHHMYASNALMLNVLCFSAALNLGCVPVRASRSQRLNNPRTYLRSAYQGYCGHMLQNENDMECNPDLMHAQASNVSMLNPLNVDSPYLVWDCSRRDALNTDQCLDIGSRGSSIAVENSTPLNRASVYPLYYGMSFKPEVSPLSFHEVIKSDPIFVGVPIFSSGESAEARRLQNLFPSGQVRNLAEETCNPTPIENEGKQPMGFDLSLRLGLFSDSSSNWEKGSTCGMERKGF